MKKFLYLILLLSCVGFILMSCEKTEDESINSTETISTVKLVFPNTNDAELTFTDVYPSYFQPMSGDGEPGIAYWFYFKEGGTITSDKSFGVRQVHITENDFEDKLLFEDNIHRHR